MITNLILAGIFIVPASASETSPKRSGLPQAVIEVQVSKLEGKGCDKLCEYSFSIGAVLFNNTKQNLESGQTIRVRALSWEQLPKVAFVAVIEPDKFGWHVRVTGKSPKEREMLVSCATGEGMARRVGRSSVARCVKPYADANRDCTDNKECTGGCVYFTDRAATAFPREGLPAPGRCKADDNPYGCTTYISNGKTAGTICKD